MQRAAVVPGEPGGIRRRQRHQPRVESGERRPCATGFVLNVSGAYNLALPLSTRGISAPVPPGSYTFTVAAANACGASPATAPQTVVVP